MTNDPFPGLICTQHKTINKIALMQREYKQYLTKGRLIEAQSAIKTHI